MTITKDIIAELKTIAAEAGEAILKVKSGAEMNIEAKQDSSPVTTADLAAQKIIIDSLQKLTPEIGIVSEEQSAKNNQKAAMQDKFWIVDPLDGTKEFISGGTDFTVNIGLISKKTPYFGIVYVPATQTWYWGRVQSGAWKQTKDEKPHQIKASTSPVVLNAVASKSHFDQNTATFLKQFGDIQLLQAGSSLKLCLVAEGKAEVYPRFAPTMEWDTAAADAIVRASGGQVLDLDGNTLKYCKPEQKNLGFICASSKIEIKDI